MSYSGTAVLLIGFGGPTRPDEVRPFLQSVLEGVRIPPSRFEEVLHHYEVMGGVSSYNAATFAQQKALQSWLKNAGHEIPVFVGFRHSTPSFKDALIEMKEQGIEKITGFILSPLRCYSSFEKYCEKLEAAKEALGFSGIEIKYLRSFHDSPLFLEAQSKKIKDVLNAHPEISNSATKFLFLAHSIPLSMDEKSGYSAQFKEIAAKIAKSLALSSWDVAYQSRSGNPADPWLTPDIKDYLRALDKNIFKNVVLIPAGFLCDNVEVVYDLDTEARQTAQELGLKYYRASTVKDDPCFIEMIGKCVLGT